MNRHTPEADKLIEKYRDGEDPRLLEQEFSLRKGSIPRMMRRWNIDRNVKRITEEQKIQAVEEYKNGLSSTIVGRKLGISPDSVRRAVKDAKVPIRPDTENKRTYKIDSRFFENIDTQEKAYFLGLLYADAAISKRGHCVSLGQEENHIDIVERFSVAIYGFVKTFVEERVLESGEKKRYWACAVYSKEMHTDLAKHGCTKKKSFTITFPTFLREDLYSHFIRGFVDGDGCISVPSDYVGDSRVDITTNLQFLIGFKAYIEPKLDIILPKFSIDKKNPTSLTRSVQISKYSDMLKFLHFIYKDATIYLECKKKNYERIVSLFSLKALQQHNKLNNIEWYSTTYVPKYKEQHITKDLYKASSDTEKQEIQDFLFYFYRENGFPTYNISDDDLLSRFNTLKKLDPERVLNDDILKMGNKLGVEFAYKFAPHLLDVRSSREFSKPTANEAFNNDFILKKVINFMLSDNEDEDHIEKYINGNRLRRYLSKPRIAYRASSFMPAVAKFIYNRYCKENDIIYDFSCGFGQRLTGAMSLPFKIKYIGVDPSERSVKSNKDIFDFLKRSVPGLNKEAELNCAGSENYCPEKYIGKVNVAFSSPPYYDLELYDNNANQACYNRSYVEFVNVWWKQVVKNIDKLLAPDGVFALNVGLMAYDFNFADDMSNVVKDFGYEVISQYKLQLSRDDVKCKLKYEPVFVFRKKV